ncbi:hypothetical protein JKP88DRAFT_278635 [Tribonema minus]|uniref:Uncharacterized protein n=1 Tax=Tribonema minus TaxID=303371 RepID=A0A835YYB2_9STRA|nr:hypothetical protein JKP88DRAFT_278635 [Tribonema minus]
MANTYDVLLLIRFEQQEQVWAKRLRASCAELDLLQHVKEAIRDAQEAGLPSFARHRLFVYDMPVQVKLLDATPKPSSTSTICVLNPHAPRDDFRTLCLRAPAALVDAALGTVGDSADFSFSGFRLRITRAGDMSAPVTVTVRGAPAAWSAAQLAMLLAPALAAPGMPIAPVRLRAGGGGTSAAFLLLASALKTCGVGINGAASSAAPASAASPGAAGVWELTVVRGVARRLAHSVLCAVDGTEVALRLLGPDNLTACPSCLRRHFTRPGQQCRATRCAHTTLPAACTTPAAATGTAAGAPAVATAAAAAAAAAATQRAPTGAAASHPPAPAATGAAATDAAAASTPALASASPGASPPPPAADADPAQLGQEQRIQQLQGGILEGRTARKGLQQQVKALTKLLAASEAGKRAAEADRDRSLAEQVRAERLAAQQRSLREGEQVRNAAATARLEAQLTAEAARAASVAVPAADAAGAVATTPVAGDLEASSAAAGAAAAVAADGATAAGAAAAGAAAAGAPPPAVGAASAAAAAAASAAADPAVALEAAAAPRQPPRSCSRGRSRCRRASSPAARHGSDCSASPSRSRQPPMPASDSSALMSDSGTPRASRKRTAAERTPGSAAEPPAARPARGLPQGQSAADRFLSTSTAQPPASEGGGGASGL